MKLKLLIDKFLERFIVVLMSTLVIDVLWQVISRYLNEALVKYFQLHIPTQLYSFTDELAGFLLIWVALAGAAYATGKKEHLSIDLLETKLNEKGKIILNRIVNICIIGFAVGVMMIGGIWLVYTRFYLGQVSASMELPIGAVYIIVPLAGILICYYAVYELFSNSVQTNKP